MTRPALVETVRKVSPEKALAELQKPKTNLIAIAKDLLEKMG